MTTKYIVNDGVTMEIESYESSSTVTIYIDNPKNLCTDNAYNGDHAGMDFTLDNVKELHAYLTQILQSKGAL